MLKLSIYLYKFLLRLYPQQFWRDYGDLMLLAFEDACHSIQMEKSWQSWIKLWYSVSVDLFISLYREHKDNIMKEKIDHYEINAVLGEGAVATLFRAYDPERSSQVALKVFQQETDITLLPHFRREGQVHPELNHPQIPKCYTYIESENNHYLVMQYIQGKSLLEMLQERNQPFDVHRVVEWGMMACDVLDYLHQQGFIYRDMKPSNLMLSKDKVLYVIDYGITVLAEGDGVAIGTIGYAPPEQYKGVCTVQSDIYALGATLHHLLTNRDPRYHEEHSFADALPRMYNSQISPALEEIIMKALSPLPEHRFSTVNDLRTALSAIKIA